MATAEGTNGATRTATEAHPRLLREGEVSPFKILTTILLRENFTHVEVKSHKAPDRMALGGFFYKLINTEDMSYKDLRSQIRNPLNCVPTEIMLSFFRITENLDDENPCFLYELVHSIIDLIDTTQIIILKKRITKNSPIGKFLRLVLFSIRKMSYPQVFHVYKQVCLHIKRDIDPSASTLLKPGSASVSRSFSRLYLQQHPPLHRGFPKPGLDIFAKMVQDRLATGRSGLELGFYKQFAIERHIQRNLYSSQKIQDTKDTDLEIKMKAEIKIMESEKLLRRFWKSQPVTKSGPSGFGNSPAVPIKRESTGLAESPVLIGIKKPAIRGRKGASKSPRKTLDSTPTSSPQAKVHRERKASEFGMYLEGEDGYFISDDEEGIAQGIGRRTRSQSRATRDSWGSSESSPRPGTSESPDEPKSSLSSSEFEFDPCDSLFPASKRWEAMKWQSRKIIEKTIKTLSQEMHSTGARRFTPRDVSSFIESIRHNPSAQVLFPQLHFLEYMNCMQIRDTTRCSESLRTSFDLRIKPNTSELNKGTPYAPYNFAVFYYLMGFKKDGMAFLEEAFQAGHSAYDPMCLHYCHNLWSSMRNKPYMDVIYAPATIKEIDKNKAYLHSNNVIANTFEQHSKGVGPTDTFHVLWDASNDYEFEAVESLILQSVANFFTVFGWHKLVEFPCMLLLKASDTISWPTQNFCAVICMYAQSSLVAGNLDKANSLMEYGKKLFRLDATLAGQLFGKQEAVFQAFTAFYGNRPIDDCVLATLASFDKIESYYWSAYSKMIRNDWEEAGNMLTKLWMSIQVKSCENNDLRLRALILQAELNCLYGNPSGGLTYLFQALELAEFISSEFYIALCYINIACIQCHLGFPSTAGKTLNQNIRSVLRSSCLYLQAKIFVANVRVGIQLQEFSEPNPDEDNSDMDLVNVYRMFKGLEPAPDTDNSDEPMPLAPKSESYSETTVQTLLERLNSAESIYKIWSNTYRLKEVLYVKHLLYRYVERTDEAEQIWADMMKIESFCPWRADTCII